MTRPDRTLQVADGVPPDSPGAREIGFTIPETYNASRILFDNLAKGRGDRPALIDRKSTRLNSSHIQKSRMPSSV